MEELLEECILELLLNKLPVDFNGHFRGGQDFQQPHVIPPYQSLVFLQKLYTPQERRQMRQAIKSGEGWGEFRRISRIWRMRCCDAFESWLVSDGRVVRFEQPCEFPHGIPHTDIEINVPSGKLVVANDLRDFFPVIGRYDIASVGGVHKTMLQYAEQGLAHGFVGNICQSVQRRRGSRRKLTIENSGATPAAATIVTDLWWYSLCDKDELLRRIEYRLETPNPDWRANDITGLTPEQVLERYRCSVVDVDPGVYRFRHYHDQEASTRAEIDRARAPDPVQDLLKEHRELSLTAEQVLYDVVRVQEDVGWDNLTDKEREVAVQRAVEQVLLVGGNGIDWHENGFAVPDAMPSGEVEIPLIEQPLRHGIQDISALSHAAGIFAIWDHCQQPLPLNESFQKLCFNVVRAALLHGIRPSPHPSGTTGTCVARKSMYRAILILRNLREKYPKTAALFPDLQGWTEEELEHHVTNFDLSALVEGPAS